MNEKPMYCLGCRKGISELEDMGYADGCPECGYPAIPVSGAIPLAVALLEFAGWQPMESAPRDGRRIMVLPRNDYPKIVHLSCFDQWFDDSEYSTPWSDDKLVGWIPLPKMEAEG